MGTYRVEWPCCGSTTETEAWEPEQCPFCEPDNAPADPALLASVAEWRQLAETQDDIIQRGATPADPPLLALARFGARIANDYHRGKYGFVSADGDWLDIDAASTVVKENQGAADLAPGIADAIAALLAPDGAASEGVTDGD